MSYKKHVLLWDFILALWWHPALERRPTWKFFTFKFLNFPYSLRAYYLPAPQRCQSAQTLHYITFHYIILHYHGILQLALYIYAFEHEAIRLPKTENNIARGTLGAPKILHLQSWSSSPAATCTGGVFPWSTSAFANLRTTE